MGTIVDTSKSMKGLLLLCFILTQLASCSGQGGKISFRLNSYSNPGGRGDNRNCCDSIFPVCKKSSQCDQYFVICLDDSENGSDDMTSCSLGTYTTGITERNDITFGNMIDTTPNPNELTFNNEWPYNIKIKVQVWDEDGTDWLGNDNEDDFVDYLSEIAGIYPDGEPNHVTLSARTTLEVRITVTCNTEGVSWDCVSPAENPSHADRAPIQCYECSTLDLTLMEDDYIDQWQALTLREMSQVQVSPQCQDVAAVPDQFLQNCEGVCLTSLWDQEQNFIFRTCLGVTQDCSALQSDPESGVTYNCFTESKGNNDRHIIEGVELPPSDVTTQPCDDQDDEVTTEPILCYECATRDMTTMDSGYITSWESLTLRSMSDVAVTPQCQDVAAVPDDYLQSCDGVCLTGIWDQDEDFLFRTCIAVTRDCSDIENDPSSGASYFCFPESKGNNDKHLIEGVQIGVETTALEEELTTEAVVDSLSSSTEGVYFQETNLLPTPPSKVSHKRIQCYECATRDMTNLQYSLIQKWEALTLRSMVDVAVTPQCQDVAATPDKYLQNCDGVCLTGLWNQDQDFLFRTCIAVTKDCSALTSDPSSGSTYHCFTETKGNNDKHLVEGVPLPASDIQKTENNQAGSSEKFIMPKQHHGWINCLSCSTALNPACENPTQDDNIESINCTYPTNAILDSQSGVRCFKSVSIINKYKTVIERGCAYSSKSHCEYHLTAAGVYTLECYCHGNHYCNAVGSLCMSSSLLFITAIAVFFHKVNIFPLQFW